VIDIHCAAFCGQGICSTGHGKCMHGQATNPPGHDTCPFSDYDTIHVPLDRVRVSYGMEEVYVDMVNDPHDMVNVYIC
jgi:hypothetical protein